MHFTLGEMRSDPDTAQLYIVPRDCGHPIMDPVIRRAMGYAIDRLSIDVNWNQGFGRPATSILSPFNSEQWICPYSPGLSIFDLDRANQMLDEAGYEWGPDGFRLDLNGDPFHVNFAIWQTATNEIVFLMHQQNMAEIGIDFRLYGDSFIDWNHMAAYTSSIHGIDPDAQCRNTEMHMFQIHWSHSGNPNPRWLWGANEFFNASRFTAPDFQAPLEAMDSMAAWCPEYFGAALMRFAEVYDRYVPAITASWSVGLTMINGRVNGWTLCRSRYMDSSLHWHEIGLTADRPTAHR